MFFATVNYAAMNTHVRGVVGTYIFISLEYIPRSGIARLYGNFIFWHACGILVPQPGIEPVPPAVEAWNPNH